MFKGKEDVLARYDRKDDADGGEGGGGSGGGSGGGGGGGGGGRGDEPEDFFGGPSQLPLPSLLHLSTS
jgi:hypothetical protein